VAEQLSTTRYLSFTLGDEIYGVPVERVEVVLEMQAITRVPNAKAQIRGVINHRGSVVPVVDPRVSFNAGLSELGQDNSIIVMQLVYEGESLTAGVLADSVSEVLDIADADLEAPPLVSGGNRDSFVRNIARQGERFIVLLDIDATLLAAEGRS
jgi:purine-binding chemotaxis protein CheW